MIDLSMRTDLLPAPLINKGFVSPASESRGECDAINRYYELDFKLFAAETSLRARNVLSSQITKIANGVYVHSGSRHENTTLQAMRLFAAFRGRSLDDLYQIRFHAGEKYSEDNDIKSALEVLETKKNVMLFFPYDFSFDVPHDYSTAIDSIREAIESDFKSAFLYRAKEAIGFDTFWTCIYDDRFLIFEVQSNALVFCESVETDKLPTYKRLKGLTDL